MLWSYPCNTQATTIEQYHSVRWISTCMQQSTIVPTQSSHTRACYLVSAEQSHATINLPYHSVLYQKLHAPCCSVWLFEPLPSPQCTCPDRNCRDPASSPPLHPKCPSKISWEQGIPPFIPWSLLSIHAFASVNPTFMYCVLTPRCSCAAPPWCLFNICVIFRWVVARREDCLHLDRLPSPLSSEFCVLLVLSVLAVAQELERFRLNQGWGQPLSCWRHFFGHCHQCDD